MKRTLASVAAAGLLTFGLAACGDDAEDEETPEDTPAATEEEPEGDDESAEPGAPGDGEETGAPGAPGDGEETGAPGLPGDGEETGAPGAPGDGEETGAPGLPGDGGETSAPDPEAQEFCDAAMEFLTTGADGSSDPEAALDGLAGLQEQAPDEVRGDLDVILNELDGLSAEELQGAEPPEGVDIEALNTAAENFGTYVGENCTSSM